MTALWARTRLARPARHTAPDRLYGGVGTVPAWRCLGNELARMPRCCYTARAALVAKARVAK
jgi:hypothetical protein